MKFKKSLVLVMVSMMTLMSACGSKTSTDSSSKSIKDGGNIIFAIGSDPQALNPLYASDRVTMTIDNALFAPLFVMNGDKNDFYLADSITPSADFMTYTLKLKKDLKWHDGKALNADDMVFTMDKIMDEKQNSFLRDLFMIDGKPVVYKKLDDTTVEFKLPVLSMAFIGALAQVTPIPKHVFENETDLSKSAKNDTPIGSGPFKFKEFKKGESITLVRFDEYFAGKAHLDSVVYRVIADENSSNVALQNGEISAKYIQPKDAEKYKNDSNFNEVIYNEGMLDNMIFNLSTKTLQNKDVRQAIAYAINKEEIIKGTYTSTSYAEKAYSILTPDVMYYTSDVNHFDYNEAKAKELLTKSGTSNIKLKLLYVNSKKDQENEALIIQQQLKKIGIEIELMPIERGAFYKKLFGGTSTDFDLAFNGYVMGTEPDSYKSLFMKGQIYNPMKYDNKTMDAMWNSATVEKDKTKRAEIYKNIQKGIVDDMVLYPIAYTKSIVAISKKIGGIKEAKTVPIFMFQDLSKLYITQ